MWTNYLSFWDDYEDPLKVTFDGVNRRIYVNSQYSELDVKEDLYSASKRWLQRRENAKFLPPFRTTGGDPVGGGQYTGDIYFLINDWLIVVNHYVKLTGIIFNNDPNLDPFIINAGGGVTNKVSNLALAYNTGGGVGTVAEVRDAVWGTTNLASYPANSAGVKLNAVGSSTDPWNTDLSIYNTPGTAGYIAKTSGTDITTIKNNTDTLEASATQIVGYVDTLETAVGTLQNSINNIPTAPTVSEIADAVRVELTPELTKIMLIENGLTDAQATMLTEIYRLYGLDPTKPLVVTDTNRSAGPEIQQTITSGSAITTVQRI